MSKRKKAKQRRGLPPMKLEHVASADYDPEVGYALLHGTQLPPVQPQPLTDEDPDAVWDLMTFEPEDES